MGGVCLVRLREEVANLGDALRAETRDDAGASRDGAGERGGVGVRDVAGDDLRAEGSEFGGDGGVDVAGHDADADAHRREAANHARTHAARATHHQHELVRGGGGQVGGGGWGGCGMWLAGYTV